MRHTSQRGAKLRCNIRIRRALLSSPARKKEVLRFDALDLESGFQLKATYAVIPPRKSNGGNAMKHWFLAAFSVVLLALALALPAAAPAAPATPKAHPAAAAAPAPEPHPEIRDAIASLQHARDHLDHAAHDFGGHRVEAIQAIDQAIAQLRICLKYDR
jgi:hypothetical protein